MTWPTWLKYLKKTCLILKVYFEKACDLVSWNFLEYMLIEFDISEKLSSWTRTCVFVSNIIVFVNWCPTQKITIKITIQRGFETRMSFSSFPFSSSGWGLGCLVVRSEDRGDWSLLWIQGCYFLVSGVTYSVCWWYSPSGRSFIGEFVVH